MPSASRFPGLRVNTVQAADRPIRLVGRYR